MSSTVMFTHIHLVEHQLSYGCHAILADHVSKALALGDWTQALYYTKLDQHCPGHCLCFCQACHLLLVCKANALCRVWAIRHLM